jgi:cell division protein FtsB
MKLSHCVTALLVSVVVLLAGNLLSAPYSADSYEALVRQKERIETNLVALQMKNDELQGRIERLRRDPDAVRVEARALGYYGAGESVVRHTSFRE